MVICPGQESYRFVGFLSWPVAARPCLTPPPGGMWALAWRSRHVRDTIDVYHQEVLITRHQRCWEHRRRVMDLEHCWGLLLKRKTSEEREATLAPFPNPLVGPLVEYAAQWQLLLSRSWWSLRFPQEGGL